MNLATALGTSAGLVTIFTIVWYTIQNDSGHTGFNPYNCLVVFLPLIVLGVTGLLSRKAPIFSWKSGLAPLVVGLVGVSLLIYLDVSNTLLPYDVWARRLSG
jgi:TctA family transporter